ncbi:MAG: ribonuclease III domain-containing protein [Leptolyngbyaceae bacterium]|nr:ribonuclease III domain-containing protein [Leptolyngbyaceae bacterium]
MKLEEGDGSEQRADDPVPLGADVLCNSLPKAASSWSQIQSISPSALAYLGDAVYELYVRSCYVLPPKRSQLYHQQVVAQVRAEAQARHLRSLQPYLTSSELDILKRGRNAASGGPKRIELEVYQQATSLETLIGYLYLSDPPRLAQLLTHLQLDVPTSE